MPGSVRWLFADTFIRQESDTFNHGTCVLSKVVSPMFGTAKKADVVIVKMEQFRPRGWEETEVAFRELNLLKGLAKILQDVRIRRFQGKAVLNISYGCKYKDLKTQFTCGHSLTHLTSSCTKTSRSRRLFRVFRGYSEESYCCGRCYSCRIW
jgi:hypothetical protein